jgi:hypothetical protein
MSGRGIYADSWKKRRKGWKTGETGEEIDLSKNNNNNHVLTGLTGLADRTPDYIEWLAKWKKLRGRNS